MARPHYSADELLAYFDRNDGIVDLAAVEAHLAACGACREIAREVERDHAVISSPLSWSHLRAVAADQPLEPGLAALLAAKERLALETGEAEGTFAVLTCLPIERWPEHLAARPAQCTEALIRRIIAAAREIEEREPQRGLKLLEIAAALVAAPIPLRPFTPETLGDLSKERANTLMVLGRYPAALAAWDDAAAAYGSGRVANFDLAFVDWGRASVYFEMSEYARALPLARSARRTLRQFGDARSAAQAELLEACILHEQGELEGAEERYRALRLRFAASGDEISLARVLANTACLNLLSGDLSAADVYAKQAAAIYATFGMETEIIRTRWALARSLRKTDAGRGAEALERVAVEFERRGLVTDAAEVRLDIVESLLERQEFVRAAALVRGIVAAFARAHAQLSVVRALDALREATAKHRATPQFVTAVRRILAHPHHPFELPN